MGTANRTRPLGVPETGARLVVVAIQAMATVAVVGAVLALPVVPVVVNAQRLAAAAMVVVAVTVAEPVVVVSLRVPQGVVLSYPAAVGHALRRQEAVTSSVMNT